MKAALAKTRRRNGESCVVASGSSIMAAWPGEKSVSKAYRGEHRRHHANVEQRNQAAAAARHISVYGGVCGDNSVAHDVAAASGGGENGGNMAKRNQRARKRVKASTVP